MIYGQCFCQAEKDLRPIMQSLYRRPCPPISMALLFKVLTLACISRGLKSRATPIAALISKALVHVVIGLKVGNLQSDPYEI